MKMNIEYGYKHNEWAVLYVDVNSERRVKLFDTFDEANNYFEYCECKIGIMTTAFYENCITWKGSI